MRTDKKENISISGMYTMAAVGKLMQFIFNNTILIRRLI
jgi:hypothetical protein